MSTYEISKSSLLSLKAEILRKQEDLSKAKYDNEEKFKNIKKKALELKNKGIEERQLNDLELEDPDLLKLSRSKLEAKSKLYDKLSKGSVKDSELKKRYLVRFDKKPKSANLPHDFFDDEPDDVPIISSEDEEHHNSDHYDDNVDPENEWTEYTDSLGRTRKCLRKDLEFIKSRDAELKSHVAEWNQTAKPTESREKESMNEDERNQEEDESEKEIQDYNESEMVSGDMRRDMLRRQWEKEEEELMDKTDIHYQNVLFNEARQHGVGYYGFSKDEDERAKQQEALKNLRNETVQQQKRAQDLKAQREKQLASRMKAARNRRRAREGLPPEEEIETVEVPPSAVQVEESEEEKQRKIDEANELERLLVNKVKKRHLRPWDIGKEKVAEFYEMSQDEWNEQKRKDRLSEFAPPSSYNSKNHSRSSTNHESKSGKSRRVSNSSSPKRRPFSSVNPYKNSEDDTEEWQKNRSEDYEPESPTISDSEEAGGISKSLIDEIRKNETSRLKKGTEIPPPLTHEYYGSSSGLRPAKNSNTANISDSIEAGLRFLRDQEENKRKKAK